MIPYMSVLDLYTIKSTLNHIKQDTEFYTAFAIEYFFYDCMNLEISLKKKSIDSLHI